MRLLYLLLTFSLLSAACDAQRSALPADSGDDVSFEYHQGGAMSRSYRRFSIEGGVLSYEELKNHQTPKISWTATVEPTEIARLYAAFRQNAFDRIENDERDGIVHDAGSESIRISIGGARSYGVTYGHNSPLSGGNLKRYQAVRMALDALLARHVSAKTTITNGDDPLTGKWRAAGDHGNGHTWYLQWRFDDGEFEMQGYPPILQKGKYRIAATDGSRLTVELYDQQGNFGTEKRTVEVLLDGAGGTIKIDQMVGFRKIED